MNFLKMDSNIDYIISQLLVEFNFALMLVINVITYFVIKFIDDVNGCKVPTTWQKRTVFVIVAIIMGFFYKYTTDISINVIINSCIVAPVAWSWLAKPIAKKLGIDYKTDN